MMHHLRSRRGFIRATGIAAAGLLLPRHAPAATPFRIGYQATLASAVDIIAVEEKLFERAGLTTTAHKFDSGRAVRDAMVANAIDIGAMGTVPFVVGAARDEMTGIAIDSYFGGLVQVQVKSGSPIMRMEELKGKRIGTAVGSNTHSVLLEIVGPAFGLKPEDYQIVNVGFGNMQSALTAGSVDAITALEPYASLGEHEGLARSLVSYDKFDPSPNILVARTAFLKANEALVVDFLKPWLAATRIFVTDKPRAASIVLREYERQGYKLPPGVIEKSLSRLRVEPEITADARKYLADSAESLKRRNQLPTLPNWDASLRTDLLKKARG
jgi:ABC-type nitrate/sulfonate/bicarbonate transport system substrate-binding protein